MKDNSCSQIRIITRIIAAACLMSMLLCYKLWLSDRVFPTSPVFDFLPILLHPFDIILFCITTILLVCIVILRNPQKFIIAFLICATTLALLDQNRWQPWFYQYVLMLFVVSFFNFRCDDTRQQQAIVTIFKLMIAAIYFWSGLQKLNPNFLSDTFPWLMEPITNHMATGAIKHFTWLGNMFPIIEILTGIGLFLAPIKKGTIIILFGMHLFILFTLGPLGHNYNPVVWPWNIAMMAFAYILFYNSNEFSIKQIRTMLHYHSLKIVAILFILMPLFNFFNLWDSYLSHNLYSGNTSGGVIYVSDKVEEKLPEEIKPYCIGDLNQNQITIKYWCMMELGVPAYPEKRNFEAITNTFYKYASDSSEIYFMFTPKLKLSDL
ncbi:hypothetical protein BH10BAC1_BH10BAC1_12940 [soil metagenome]